jgi:putative DNA-invertase from lambdoid prophage Rac
MMSVYGYARVSTGRQAGEGVSLEEQQRRIGGRALEQGWEVAEMFVERGVSGSVPFADRPQGKRLTGLLRPGDVVVAAKLDRMFRSAADALYIIGIFNEHKISLWLLDLGGDVSGNGIARLMMTVLAAVAEFERDRIIDRILEAKAHLRCQGKFLGGSRPFGYQVGAAGELVPDATEQDAIGEMARLREAGASLHQISRTMQARGIIISRPSVQQVLERRVPAPPAPR